MVDHLSGIHSYILENQAGQTSRLVAGPSHQSKVTTGVLKSLVCLRLYQSIGSQSPSGGDSWRPVGSAGVQGLLSPWTQTLFSCPLCNFFSFCYTHPPGLSSGISWVRILRCLDIPTSSELQTEPSIQLLPRPLTAIYCHTHPCKCHVCTVALQVPSQVASVSLSLSVTLSFPASPSTLSFCRPGSTLFSALTC